MFLAHGDIVWWLSLSLCSLSHLCTLHPLGCEDRDIAPCRGQNVGGQSWGWQGTPGWPRVPLPKG